MTLALDTSALLGRYLSTPAGDLVLEAMSMDRDWCASELARTEALMAIERLVDDTADRAEVRRALLDDWQRFWVVPVDAGCLDRAAALGRDQPLRSSDAVHLAAALRLPRPTSYLTFDPRQIPVALALGLDVVSA
ncbi:MAG: type II toxin-antitoxin system VapC family toxin [Acidimicrobiia bacterium]